MAKRKKRPGPEEKNILIHYYDGNEWDFNVVFGLSAAIEKAAILTDKGYKCNIGYTDEEGMHVQVQ